MPKPLLLICCLALGGCSQLYDSLGGDFHGPPCGMWANISDEAKGLIRNAFAFSSSGRLTYTDYHVHVLAADTSTESSGAYINPARFTWRNPGRKFQTSILMSATKVNDPDQLDRQYAERLLDLLRHFQAVQAANNPDLESRFLLYAFAYYHGEHGRPNRKASDIHVPNQYVIYLAKWINEQLADAKESLGAGKVRAVPVASVHPNSANAVASVNALARQGVRFIKWLPQAMNIDPENVSDDFYRAMAENQMILLSHTGHERAVHSPKKLQYLSDPLKLCKALNHKVTVVALHSGRLEKYPRAGPVPAECCSGRQEKCPEAAGKSYYDRFRQLMNIERYRGQVFGEISSITIGKIKTGDSSNLVKELAEASRNDTFRGRLVNGSDYPLPAVKLLHYELKKLVQLGQLTEDEMKWLGEIRSYNPLLYDFVLKRTLGKSAGHPFAEDVFVSRREYTVFP